MYDYLSSITVKASKTKLFIFSLVVYEKKEVGKKAICALSIDSFLKNKFAMLGGSTEGQNWSKWF